MEMQEIDEREENPLMGGDEHGRAGNWSPALNTAAKHEKLKAKLNAHRNAVIGLACCVCILLVVIFLGVIDALVPHHSHRHENEFKLSLELQRAQQQTLDLLQREQQNRDGGGSGNVAVSHFQDDLCPTVSPLQAQDCSDKGGVCVKSADDCDGGTIKGTCGSDCGCCFSGCPMFWRGTTSDIHRAGSQAIDPVCARR